MTAPSSTSAVSYYGRKRCNNLLVSGKKIEFGPQWPTRRMKSLPPAWTAKKYIERGYICFSFSFSFFFFFIFGYFLSLLLLLLSRTFLTFIDHLKGKLLVSSRILKGMGIWKLDPINSILIQFIITRVWRRVDKKQNKKQIKRMNKNNKFKMLRNQFPLRISSLQPVHHRVSVFLPWHANRKIFKSEILKIEKFVWTSNYI